MNLRIINVFSPPQSRPGGDISPPGIESNRFPSDLQLYPPGWPRRYLSLPFSDNTSAPGRPDPPEWARPKPRLATAIWNTLKEDLGDDKTNINRVFDVLLEEPEMLEFHNGKETIEVRALPFAFKEDAEPAKKKTSKDDPVANSTADDTEEFPNKDI